MTSTLASAQTTHDPTRRSTTSAAQRPKGFAEKRAIVDGVTIRYTIGGQGPGVVLLHGYAQTSHMWMPLMPRLTSSHTVIAPDLRGAGGSARPPDGYDKKTLAKDIRGLVRQLGHERVQLVGHDSRSGCTGGSFVGVACPNRPGGRWRCSSSGPRTGQLPPRRRRRVGPLWGRFPRGRLVSAGNFVVAPRGGKSRKNRANWLKKLEPAPGLEPGTCRLRIDCSTN